MGGGYGYARPKERRKVSIAKTERASPSPPALQKAPVPELPDSVLVQKIREKFEEEKRNHFLKRKATEIKLPEVVTPPPRFFDQSPLPALKGTPRRDYEPPQLERWKISPRHIMRDAANPSPRLISPFTERGL